MKPNPSVLLLDSSQINNINCKTLFDLNRDSITIFRINADSIPSNFIEANPATTTLFGYTKKELLSLSIRDIVELTDKKSKSMIANLQTKGRIIFTTTIKNKKDKIRTVEVETFLINYENEPAFMNITRDITDRKQLEQNISKAYNNVSTILDAIPDLLFEVGIDGRIYHYHSHRTDLLAVPAAVFIDQLFQDVLPADVSKICMEAIQETNVKGWSTGKQYALDLPNGKKWFELSVSPINDSNNDDKHFILLARDITDRKMAENILKENEENLQVIFDSISEAIYIVDKSGTFINVNKGTEKMYQYSRKELIGKSLLNFAAQSLNDQSAIQSKMKSVCKTGNPEQFEFWAVRKNGVIFPTEVVFDKCKYFGKEVLIATARDITKRKKAEDSLRKSEEKIKSIFNLANSGIVLTDIKGNFLEFNHKWLEMLGYTPEEMKKLTNLNITHPNDIEKTKLWGNKVYNAEIERYQIEKRYITKDKSVFWGEESVSVIKDEHNKIINTVGIISDISERKYTQEKIKQLSQAVEQSPVTIIITNTSGEVEYANPKFYETTGYTVEEILGKNLTIIKTNHTSSDEYKQLWQTISSGNEWFGEFHNRKKDGTLYWESASISPIINSFGKITHYIAIKEDITERKRVEKQLIKAKEKAEESDRLKLAFLANMSHEIRTPMNGILGFTELLKETQLDREVQQEYIGIIEKSGVRMLNIINDIINISKIESGQVELSLSETNINEQMLYIQTFFKPEATLKGITLIASKLLPLNEAIIKTDLEKIYAILTNLVKNALKFTNSGTIEFGCFKKENNLEFFVKDTGLGISKSQQKIIFERFRQANDTTSRSHEGSGLGLAISKAYVKKLGGKIWLESEENKGSSFYFTIPFVSYSAQKHKTITKRIDIPKKIALNIKNLKVLIVEDDSISKLLITIAVKPFSKEILKVSTGFEAVEACRNNPDIDLVMMDINMPEMGGYEATKKIREFNKNIIIIAQTANGMQSDRDKAIEAGCTDYIPKPINIAFLSDLILKYFENKMSHNTD
ncbi:PAS domain S-box protein [Flavobacterium cellulosilyticum]|uniref:histidine kinase n=1 Tax=Flavobacterium cellulosilyticum TaxID=2541731 RepID=A0A4R5CD62_9FLAO|nr:PAS domain S-box protein [Flavobacterium cellulosilyticum]TDD97961.1 PAS domain S-box protein [Flavobacterium cellulosilyticum]